MSQSLASQSPQPITNLTVGSHLCFFYETEREHRAVLTSFLREGLERGEKVIYLADAHEPAVVVDYLHNQRGLGRYLADRQLTTINAEGLYLSGGSFLPENVITRLWEETERALAEGFAGLRVTGEMTWAQRQAPGSERLAEYEAKLSDFFSTNKCTALCQYPQRSFEPELLLDIVVAHPLLAVGEACYPNNCYLPPAQFLRGSLRQAAGRRWLQSVAGPASSAHEDRPLKREAFDAILDALRRAPRSNPPTDP